MDETDPVEAAADDSRDLYGVATWEPRTLLDRVAAALYRLAVTAARAFVVALAAAVLLTQFVLGGLGAALGQPAVAVLVTLSALPAFALAAYVWRADVTMDDPLWVLVATFSLGVLLATFAGVVNSLARPLFAGVALGAVLFFYLVVAPVEETVKLLAVRLYAYGSDSFDSVLDGAAYGAMAGLGFATIENALYVSRSVEGAEAFGAVLATAGGTAALRALAGPGHVIYSAFAGYYLGLAKFNSRNAGPIVVKGLLVAVLLHGTYNVLVGIVPGLLLSAFPSLLRVQALLAFVVVYDGLFGYLLYRRLQRYRDVYYAVTDEPAAAASDD